MHTARCAFASLALLVTALPAAADWPAVGKRVTLALDSVNGTRMVRMFDLPFGDIAVVSVGGGARRGRARALLRPGHGTCGHAEHTRRREPLTAHSGCFSLSFAHLAIGGIAWPRVQQSMSI